MPSTGISPDLKNNRSPVEGYFFIMANPQKENGYIAIANEIAEALAKAMPGFTEGQIIWCVLRKTYGWNKKVDKISITQLQEMTNKSRRMIIYAIQNLEAKNMLRVYRCNHQINEIAFEKDYEQWIVQEKSKQYSRTLELRRNYYKNTSARKNASARNGIKLVQEMVKDVQFLAPTKDNNTKDNTKDNIYISEFFDYFLLKTKKAFKLTTAARSLIQKRLKEGFTTAQLKQAVDNFVLDDWPERHKHLDLIYCIGKQNGKPDNLEKWLNYKPKTGSVRYE